MKILYVCSLVQEDLFHHKTHKFDLKDKIIVASKEFTIEGGDFTPGKVYALEITGPVSE